MKPDRSQWRDKAAYDYMEALSVEDLAWEALRRNEDYQKDFGRHVRAHAHPLDDFEAAIAQHWGLRFRCTAEPKRSGTIDLLDPACRSCGHRSCETT